MDTVSVIVPVYNVEKYLLRCVQSILSQSYKKLEIILVDDGSRDSSARICDQLAGQDNRIKVIHQENQGLGGARNTGLRNATGEFVTFIDSDDYIGITHIEKLYNSAVKTSADVAVGFYVSVDENGKIARKKNFLKIGEYEREAVFNELLLPMIGTKENHHSDTAVEPSCCMNLYRLAMIKNNNICFESTKEIIAEDQFFNIDCFVYAQKVVVTEVDDYYYYVNLQSMTRKYDQERFNRTVNYYHTLKRKVDRYGLLELAERRIDRSFLMKTRIALRLIAYSDMGFVNKVSKIGSILDHDLLVMVLKEYPIHTYPVMMRVLSQLMRRKCSFGVYVLIKARDFHKKMMCLTKRTCTRG